AQDEAALRNEEARQGDGHGQDPARQGPPGHPPDAEEGHRPHPPRRRHGLDLQERHPAREEDAGAL
ncbi:MAG: LSU ribosomal protein L35p, partial [uncultured Nocardioidaceae bacterium]